MAGFGGVFGRFLAALSDRKRDDCEAVHGLILKRLWVFLRAKRKEGWKWLERWRTG